MKTRIYTEILEAEGIEEDSITYNKNRDFTTLKTWKHCRKVKLFFYKTIVPLLPDEERFSLESQIRRAAVSITANIAEGYGRFHYQEGIQYYRISRASLYELKDHLITCLDLQYIDKQLFDEGISLIEEAKKTLNGYIGYVIRQKKSN